MVAAGRSTSAHAIGMSGLLVKSTVVMRENLEEMSRQGVDGAGAARRRRADAQLRRGGLRAAYACGGSPTRATRRRVHLMDRVMGQRFDDLPWLRPGQAQRQVAQREAHTSAPRPARLRAGDVNYAQRRRPPRDGDEPVPTAPFWGARVIEAAPKAVVPFINERSLYQFQWGFRKAGPLAWTTSSAGRSRSCAGA
jgi:5-methyltetrahydrofolate--homocysteine methyltransferase